VKKPLPLFDREAKLMYPEAHAHLLHKLNLAIPTSFLLTILTFLAIVVFGGPSYIILIAFITTIVLPIFKFCIDFLVWSGILPLRCQTPGCNGRMEITEKPISAFKVELRYRCPICNHVYVCEIFPPNRAGDYPP
jgi:hypothetical protein